jgi:hypothetical protein
MVYSHSVADFMETNFHLFPFSKMHFFPSTLLEDPSPQQQNTS